MALMDEFKEERERIIKNGTRKEKLSYFWEYYKWYVIVPAIIIIAVGNYIYHVVTAPEVLLSGVLLNAAGMEKEELISDFCEENKIDTKEYSVDLNTGVSYVAKDESGVANYESSQALMAWIAAGSIDFINGDLDSMIELAYKDYFVDLTEMMSEEQIAKYEPYFLYIDYAVITNANAAYVENLEAPAIVIPDCTKPEEMEDPIPVLIDMNQCEELVEGYGSATDTVALGVTVNAKNKDRTLHFVDYLMDE